MDKDKAKSFLIKSAIFKVLGMVGGTTFAVVGVVILFMIIVASILNADFDSGTGGIGGGSQPLPSHVEEVRPLVEEAAKENDVSQYTDLILALIAQESGGNPDVVDIMQASESMCDGKIGCIDSVEESISYGVEYFAQVLEEANNDVLLALQSYNFGSGFIDYANKNNNGKYSEELAIKFSQKMFKDSGYDYDTYTCIRAGAKELKACYGDINYVKAVTAYYHPVSSDGLSNIGGSVAGSLENVEVSEDMDIERSSDNTYLAGHCTFFAFEIRKKMGNPVPNSWGDADDWVEHAEDNDGFEVSMKPKKGAVYQLDRGGRDCCYGYGHVGIVTEVFDNGDFIVTEMNWDGLWNITSRKLSLHKDDNFIL